MKIKRKKKKLTEAGESTPLLLVSPSLDAGQISTFEENISQARNVLYTSHLAAKFTEIGWQFCLILFLSALTGYQSLALVSTYGLFSGLVVCLTGSSAGAFVDSAHYTRLQIIQLFIIVQNLSVVVATACFFFLLRMVKEIDLVPLQQDTSTRFLALGAPTVSRHIFSNFVPPLNATTIGLLVAIHVFGALAKLSDQGITIAFERDWIVVMSKVAASDIEDDDENFRPMEGDKSLGSNASSTLYSAGEISVGDADGINTGVIRKLKEKSWLSETNTTMKQIDLLCKVVAPAAAGLFLSAFDNNDPTNSLATDIQHWYNLSYAAVIIGAMNLGSLYVEYSCTLDIYCRVPILSARNGRDNEKAKIEDLPSKASIGCGIFSLPRSLSLYLEQPVAMGGIALSLLYLNVLTFGGLMTAYLVWLGVNYSLIGTLRGFSAVVGLLGTVAFRISERQNGLASTGMWSIMIQFGFLALCYLSLFVQKLDFSLWLLVIGVCCSRIGLWAFDLTVTQYMQQQIPEKIRGLIGGVQKSLNSFFDLSTFALGLIFSDPHDFYVLVAMGYTSVGIAMMLYYFGVYKKKDTFH